MDDRPRLLSLDETQSIVADHDYLSTADNLHWYGRESDDPCFLLESLPVLHIDPGQLIDDPDDEDGWAKVASIRAGLRKGDNLPPTYVRHHPGYKHPYELFEGKHRYNAAYAEDVGTILAWVAHIDCCELGGTDV